MLKKYPLGLLPLCFSLCSHAGDMGRLPVYTYFASVSGGPSWTDAGTSQTITLQPDVIKAYVPQNLSNWNILGNLELFVGAKKSFFDQVQSQFGLALYGSSVAELNGFVQEDGDPNYQNFSYQYKISHWHLALKTKWIAQNAFNLNPYVSGSIGIGFNHAYGYSQTPLILQEIPAPPFESNTKTALSYSLGAGFQHTLNQQVTIALGYQLVSWGGSELARAVGQTSGGGLRLGNLYTQGVECTISYLL